MKFLAFIFIAVSAVSAVEASSLRVSAVQDIAEVIHTPNAPGSDVQGGNRELTEFYDDYDYRKIYTYWTGQGTRCWDAKSFGSSGTPIPYARECRYDEGQYWTYTKYGQIYNKKYGKCLTYDYDKQHEHYYYDSKGNEYPVYLYLDECYDYAWQRFLYVDKHWVSAYDGTCIDLVRDHGGYFATEKCKKCSKDHLHTIEEYWFSDFDDSTGCAI
jgi:hypothetical protein